MAALSTFAVLVGVPKGIAPLPGSGRGGDIQCLLKCSPLECNGCACGGDYFHCVGSLGCTANYYACATGHSCSPYCLPCPPLVPA